MLKTSNLATFLKHHESVIQADVATPNVRNYSLLVSTLSPASPLFQLIYNAEPSIQNSIHWRMLLEEVQNHRCSIEACRLMPLPCVIIVRLRGWPVMSDGRVIHKLNQSSIGSLAKAIYNCITCQLRGHILHTHLVSPRPLPYEMWNRWEKFSLLFATVVRDRTVLVTVESKERDVGPVWRTGNFNRGRTTG